MKVSKKNFYSICDRLPKIKILVVGDAVLDEYLFGEVNRISPEAPVPVVLVKEDKITLGGAGNVIKNLSSIGVKVRNPLGFHFRFFISEEKQDTEL
jgi:bifunctional ADP-heptose synthase (sugar kinase/adenylyltransferase)